MQENDFFSKVEEALNGGSYSMQGWPTDSAANADVDVSMAIACRQHLLPPTALVPPVVSGNMRNGANDSPLSSSPSSQQLPQHTPAPGALARLRAGIIGRTATFTSPFGQRALVHADNASACRPLQPLEDYIGANVSPWYLAEQTSRSNSKLLSAFLRDARESIASFAGARRDEYAVIFAGHSAAAATGKMAQMLGVLDTTLAAHQPVIIHCTTEDPAVAAVWRDVCCQHVVVPTDGNGQPDLRSVREALIMHSASPLVVGCFSLGCPVTGVVADVRALTRLLHEFGAVAAFDYTNAVATVTVPCIPPGGSLDAAEQIDAVLLASSQLAGGVGGAGVLVIRRSVIQVAVAEGSGWDGDGCSGGDGQHVDNFIADVEQQEGGDQHNAMGIIRAGIAAQLHIDMKPNAMHAITREYTARALNAWRSIPGLWLLGEGQGRFVSDERLPVISFNVLVKRFHPVEEARGSGCMILHHNFVASVLSDIYGIQVSVGNAFDGPNGFEHIHDTLVNVCGHGRDALEKPVACGLGWVQPGWVQVRFNHLMTSKEVDLIIRAVMEVGLDGWKLLPQYDCSMSTGHFMHHTEGSMKQVNAMRRASQQILSTTGSKPSEGSRMEAAADPDSPTAALPVQEASDMSHTHCLSFASSGVGYPRSTLRGMFQSLLCRSGSGHSPSSSSRSLPQSALRGDDLRMENSVLSASCMSALDSMVDGRNVFQHKRGSNGCETITGLEQQARMALSEPRLMHVQPDKFVLEGGTADTVWERDMRAEGTAYVHWARCPFRWFLLQHEAASAIRMHASLTL